MGERIRGSAIFEIRRLIIDTNKVYTRDTRRHLMSSNIDDVDLEYLDIDKLTSLLRTFEVLCKLNLESAYPVIQLILKRLFRDIWIDGGPLSLE